MDARVLIVDDDVELGQLIAEGLAKLGYHAEHRSSADEAFELVLDGEFEVVLTDLKMRGMGGIELCDRIVANRPDVPVIVMTAFGSLEAAMATVRAGACDFLTKPFGIDAVALAVERALGHRRLREEVKRLQVAAAEVERFDELLGDSVSMRKVYGFVERVADSDSTVLITGESGTGKELIARALHRRSRRRKGPMVAINCAALPEPLLESELFGHARGAFTDAREKRAGLMVEAHGGTLFLDEVADMPLTVQAKLLRALEARVVRPVGSNVEVPFDARVVAATNRDLEQATDEERFRKDLLYRLNVIQIELPPLRSRSGDILLLAQHFLQRFASRSGKTIRGLSSAVAEKLLSYSWPGNVRELQNCMERAVALAQWEEVVPEDLPEKIRDYKRSHVLVSSDDPTELVAMEEVEKRYVFRVMEAVAGNKNMAARILGWDRKTLYRRLERWGYAA